MPRMMRWVPTSALCIGAFGCAAARNGDVVVVQDAQADAEKAHIVDAPIDAHRLIDAPHVIIDAPHLIDASTGGPVSMTQASSTTVVSGNSFNCNYGPNTFYTAENSYYRVFPLADYNITTTLHVSSV
jgi:hypothetical protein